MIPYLPALLHFHAIMLNLPPSIYSYIIVSFLLLLGPSILRYIFEHIR